MEMKKGFTLIELIVVIAIIGVLAAILVPAMLGYIRKSKIQSANSAANTILKAANSALQEMEEAEVAGIPSGDVIVGSLADDSLTWNEETLVSYISLYSDDVYIDDFRMGIKNGVAVICVTKSGKYYGALPVSWNNKNYDNKTSNDISIAWNTVVDKYNRYHENNQFSARQGNG